MEKYEYEDYRFQFILTVDEKIICHRLFDIKWYNELVIHSLDLKTLVDDCVDIIETSLKEKSYEDLWSTFNPYYVQTEERISKEKDVRQSNFGFKILVDNNIVVEKSFDGSVYPLNVRYNIDVRNLIYPIVKEIRRVFCSKNLELAPKTPIQLAEEACRRKTQRYFSTI
jgi:hypothetical protein